MHPSQVGQNIKRKNKVREGVPGNWWNICVNEASVWCDREDYSWGVCINYRFLNGKLVMHQ